MGRQAFQKTIKRIRQLEYKGTSSAKEKTELAELNNKIKEHTSYGVT